MPEIDSQLLELSSMFRSLVKKMTNEWKRRMGDGFSMTQFRTLYVLNSRGPQKAADLAEILCVTSGAITGLADKLILKQLLERQRSEDDRRVVYLSITDKGKEMLDGLLEKQKETISLFFEGLPKEDIDHLKRIFELMLIRVDQLEQEKD
ncbi:MAG: transcriptional regulator, MarR family [Paenibacillus sp.]|jgi:DNA-binding MarR family transcriptional regulator|nr:transcriptional regulator, MarR family [Paenibacillus sp.]